MRRRRLRCSSFVPICPVSITILRLMHATINACKVESVLNAQNKSIGYALRDPPGQDAAPIRGRAGRQADRSVELLPGWIRGLSRRRSERRPHLDECRWLNSGGSRIALIERGKITGWKQISAEEASKVLGPGARCRRCGLARNRDGDAGGATARGRAQGSRRQGRGGIRETGRAVCRAAETTRSAGTPRRSGIDSTGRFRT